VQVCPHWQRLLSMREARAVFEPRMHPVTDAFEAALQPHNAAVAPGATWQDAHTLYQAILAGNAPQAHLVPLLHASLRSLTLSAPPVRNPTLADSDLRRQQPRVLTEVYETVSPARQSSLYWNLTVSSQDVGAGDGRGCTRLECVDSAVLSAVASDRRAAGCTVARGQVKYEGDALTILSQRRLQLTPLATVGTPSVPLPSYTPLSACASIRALVNPMLARMHSGPER